MSKVFFSYEQQIEKLQKEKGLKIDNVEYAKTVLKDVSYYSLIGGYKHPFKHLPSGNYKYDVKFEEIVALYYFDERLRFIFLEYILHVERKMKSLLSYHFCDKYGEKQKEYLNPQNYNINNKNSEDIAKMISYLRTAVTLPTDRNYIVHHVKHYNNVPLWVAVNGITFGNLAKMYQYCSSDIRSSISKEYDAVTEYDLQQFLRILASCRNICAHGERLFTFHTRVTGPDTTIHKKMMIRQKKGAYTLGKHDLFAVVIALRYLISNDEFKEFKRKLRSAIKEVLVKCPHLNEAQLNGYMGFPSNWNNIARYSKH